MHQEEQAQPGQPDPVTALVALMTDNGDVASKALAALGRIEGLLRNSPPLVIAIARELGDLDGMRAELAGFNATAGTEAAVAFAQVARQKHEEGWDDHAAAAQQEQAPAPEAPRRLRLAVPPAPAIRLPATA